MDDNQEVKIPGWLKGLVALSLLVAVVALGLYFWNFNDELADKQETWGQFGDFIGGTLNPLFAVTALFALLYTIIQQSKELRDSRIQLKRSADAMASQNKVMEKQNFEATFFQMLRLFNELIGGVRVVIAPTVTMSGAEFHHRMAIKHLRDRLANDFIGTKGSAEMSQGEIDERYRTFYARNGGYMGHYFRTLYNILKFVDRSALTDDEKKMYTNLLRAQLSKEELGLLFYNCISDYGRDKTLPLVKKYDILQHLEDDALAAPEHRHLLDNL